MCLAGGAANNSLCSNIASHIGQEIIHLDEAWEQEVSMDFIFFEPAEMEGYLQIADFEVEEIEEIVEREPYPDVEHQSRRAYIFARKPKH